MIVASSTIVAGGAPVPFSDLTIELLADLLLDVAEASQADKPATTGDGDPAGASE